MPQPLILIPGDKDQERGYKITKWHSHNNFECLYCQYATLYEDKMIEHQMDDNHAWPFPSGTSTSETTASETDDLKY